MKTQIRIWVLSLLAVLSLMIAAIPASAGLLFSNGSPAGNIYGWEIDNGFAVSDSFSFASGGTATSFTVGLWVLPGQKPHSLEWSVTGAEFGGTVYGSGNYTFVGLGTDLTLWGTAQGYIGGGPAGSGTACPAAGCDLYEATVNIPGGLPLLSGSTYWLNLQNATADTPGGIVGWDENDGPHSLASQNATGTIGSEDPDFFGTPDGGNTPEPSSVVLFGSGVLGLAGIFRRRFIR